MKKTTNLELIAFTLLMLIVPIVFLIAINLLGYNFLFKPFLLGALGWFIALTLRYPFIFLIRKIHTTDSRKTIFTILLSGPTEETTRLVFLILIGFNFHSALILALGWASIEVIYTIAQAIGVVNLRERTDEKAIKAKKLIEEQGMGTILEEHSPAIAVLERISATFIHIGFTMLLLVNPFIVLIDMVIHSSINLFAVYMAKKSIIKMELYLLLISLLLVGISLLFYFK